jgi:hypothetical protein
VDGKSMLTIHGKTKYNGSLVQCKAVSVGVAVVQSENVTLYIQGTLGPVGDLKTSSGSPSVFVSWTAPFSLDVTDIWYTVFIYKYNVKDDVRPNAVPCTDCTEFVDTSYTFTPEHPSPCARYYFTVIPYNGAGQGQINSNVTGYAIDPGLNIVFKKSYINTNMDRITFIFAGDLGKVCFYMLHSMAHSIDFDDKSSNGRVVYHANVKFEPNMIVKNMTCDIVNAATKISLPVSFCKLFV